MCVCVCPHVSKHLPLPVDAMGGGVRLKPGQLVKGLECQAKEFGLICLRALGSHRRALSKRVQGQI